MDRTEILVGVVLQFFGFLIFWLLPAHNSKQLWKFALGSVVFVAGLPFVYIAPALQAKLTTMRTQVSITFIVVMAVVGAVSGGRQKAQDKNTWGWQLASSN